MGIPDVSRQKFKYSENNFHFSLGTTDQLLSQDFAMNDPHDPYVSIGGKSALFFPQMFANYKYCRVYGATITVKITDNSAANTTPMFFALVLNSNLNGDTPSEVDTILALPKSRCKILKSYPNRIGGTKYLKMFAHVSDIFYWTRQQYDAQIPSTDFDLTNIGGIVSPTNKALCTLFYGRLDSNSTVAVDCLGEVHIRYYTKMWLRQNFTEAGTDHDVEPPALEPLSETPLTIDNSDSEVDLSDEYLSGPDNPDNYPE